METNMTRGNPMLIIVRFLIPLLIGNLFQQLYNMADSIIVGKFVGSEALAGVGATGTIMFLVIGFANGIAIGFTVLTSQRYGAGDYDGTRRSVSNAIILCAIFGIFVTIASISIMPGLLHLMHTPDSIYDESYQYITTICAGTLATLYYNLFSSLLRAIGNSRIPLYFLILSAGLNVILDLVFIIFLGWGVAGAARATVLAQGISALLCLAYIMIRVPVLKPGREDWKLHAEESLAQLRVGIPMALQYAITASGTMVMQSAINRFDQAIAPFTAASKLQNLVMQGHISVGLTMAAYTGQNYGARNADRIHRGSLESLKLVVGYSLVSGFIMVTALPYLLHLFFPGGTNITPLLPWARTYLLECVVCYIPLGMIFIYRNTIQGCGYGLAAMSMGIVELGARFLTAFLSIRLKSYPLAVGCDPAAWLTAGIYGFIVYLIILKKIRSEFSR